jgi:pimeloyl-ACP methyl ester carboxylesterase
MLPILPELERFKEKSMNMQRRISFFIGIALLFTTASFAQQVKTDYDRSTDFSQYKSYSWENVNTQNLLWVDRIKTAVNSALAAKGWTQAESGGNVSIMAMEMTQSHQTLNTYYDSFGGGWGWGRRFGGGGNGFGESTTTQDTYRVGTLVVDLFDSNTKNLIWRGSLSDVLSDKSEKNIKNLNKGVEKLFSHFPPDTGRSSASRNIQPVATADASANSLPPTSLPAAPNDSAIRPFHINIPDEQIVELRHRIAATRWPDKETVNDESQGIRLAEVQALVQYWGNGYNWRNIEAKLNALPEYVTTIDGVDIQFIHVRSREPNALPLILTHGWPGSPLEFLKVIGPLTDPVAYGGNAQDAFDVVIPAIPGYGFSGKPTDLGWNPDRVARAWDVLMKRLGYTRYVSQGGDHGSVVSDALARQAPPGLLGIHITMPATIPANLVEGINSGEPAPTGLTAPELLAYNTLSTFFGRGAAYGAMMVTRPQTIGYSLVDSPSGLAAFTYEKVVEWSDSDGHPERVIGRDEILDDITLYWLTNTGASSSRFYWENNNNNFSAAAQKTNQIKVPVAITVFPHEIYRAPETWSRQAYPSLYYFHEAAKGGHFAAWEQPEIFSTELRAAFRTLR